MIAIRADCNSEIGMGHIMRCLSVADSITALGEEVCFIVSKDTDISFFDNVPYNYFVLQDDKDIWSAKEVCEILKNKSIETLFLDSYRVTEEKINELSATVKVCYLDDLHLFDYNVNTVINYNIEATNSDYLPTKYLNRKLYVGAEYFPLRSEFQNAGKIVIKKDIQNVLITTGSTDKNHITKQIVEAIEVNKYPNIHFHILKGKFYNDAYKNELDNLADGYSNVHILGWGQTMAELYLKTDLVIAPGSTTTFEALSLNVPCISFEFVDNQHEQCMCMENMGIAPYIGNFAENAIKTEVIKAVFTNMLGFTYRKNLEANYSKLFDGKGSHRIAEIVIGRK